MAWFSSSLGPDSCPHYVLNGCHLALNQFLTGPWHWSSTQRHSGSHYGLTPFPLFSFLFLKFIYFNWRLVTLQYCSGFAIHWHESAMSVHVFLILNTPPTSLHLLDLPHILTHWSGPHIALILSIIVCWFLSSLLHYSGAHYVLVFH